MNKHCNIAARLPELARERPDQIAIRCPGRPGPGGMAAYDVTLDYRSLDARSDAIDIVICAISGASSADRLTFAQWARVTHPAVRVLIAATVEKSARLAAEICEEGPHLRKPYEHQALLDWIKRLRS